METNIEIVMERLTPYLSLIDNILRHGHTVYDSYPPEIVVDHDASTQAHCTNRHILARAHSELDEMPLVRHLEIGQQNLWLFETAQIAMRFKKTNEDGISSNYQTKQARAFDRGEQLPGLPPVPTRLTAGYLLDATGTDYVRSQISLPTNLGAMWCAAIVSDDAAVEPDKAWYDVTRQREARF